MPVPWEERWIPEPNTGCFLWLGHINNKGYGMASHNRKTTTAHRVAWERGRGPIPIGLQVLHKCDTRGCVNVDHLFLGTPQDNMDDKMQKGRHYTPFGDGHRRVRISDAQIAEIRRLCAAGARPAEVARMFDMPRTNVSAILKGKYRKRAWA